eukprot:2608448-Pyramimonas_sp.AAC.1
MSQGRRPWTARCCSFASWTLSTRLTTCFRSHWVLGWIQHCAARARSGRHLQPSAEAQSVIDRIERARWSS